MSRYFVSYAYANTSGTGYGNVTIDVDGDVTVEDDIRMVEQGIAMKVTTTPDDPTSVVLLHLQRLSPPS